MGGAGSPEKRGVGGAEPGPAEAMGAPGAGPEIVEEPSARNAPVNSWQ